MFREVEYNDEERWNEIERLAQEVEGTKFTVGQQLYYQVHYFANPRFLWDKEYDRLIEEFYVMQQMNIPFATSLDRAPSQRLRDFVTIKEEVAALQKHQMEKNSGNA